MEITDTESIRFVYEGDTIDSSLTVGQIGLNH